MSEANPLAKYFRKPVLYVDLPSNGKWYPDGVLKYDVGTEVAVYSMTAMDEILLKSPDALLNGVAIVNLIKSCVPAISDPWQAPIIDIDKLLIAQRIASYGQKMDITVKCPKCNEANTYVADLSTLLGSFKTIDYSAPLMIGDISVWIKPVSYKTMTSLKVLSFNNENLIRSFDKESLTTEQQAFYDKLRESAINMSLMSMAASVERIKVGDLDVSDYDFIRDYLSNIDRDTFNTIKKFVEDNATVSQRIDEFDIVCSTEAKDDVPACGHQFKVPFSFDVSNFFVFGS